MDVEVLPAARESASRLHLRHNLPAVEPGGTTTNSQPGVGGGWVRWGLRPDVICLRPPAAHPLSTASVW